MTDEQINATIAKEIGWTQVEAMHRSGRAPGATYVGREFIPDYCTDLNAMHEAESILHRKKPEFSQILLDLVSEAAGVGVQYAHGSFAHIHAHAKLRAEAFLRTLGKWEEVLK